MKFFALFFIIAGTVQGMILTQEWRFTAADFVIIPHGDYTFIQMPDALYSMHAPGAPDLPVVVSTCLLPWGYHVMDVTYDAAYETLLTDITPSPVPVPRRPGDTVQIAHTVVFDELPETPFPSRAIDVSRTGSAVGLRFTDVQVHPLRFNSDTRQVDFARYIRILVHLGRDAEPPPPVRDTPAARAFLSTVDMSRSMPAYADIRTRMRSRNDEVETFDYLIITRATLTNVFAQLAAHRAEVNGMRTVIRTVEDIADAFTGVDIQDKIRNCIREYVFSNSLSYVVLGGDDTIVPVRHTYVHVHAASGLEQEYTMPTDLYYSGLDGTWDENGNGIYGEAETAVGSEGDLVPDVIVGRIPIRSAAHAAAYINKLIAYENAPPSAQDTRRLLMGGVELWSRYTGWHRPDDTMDDGHAQFMDHSPVTDAEMWIRRLHRDGIQPHWQALTLGFLFDSLTTWDTHVAGDYAASAAHFKDQFNAGWYHVFIGTHGNITDWSVEGHGSFNRTDAASLTNMIPIMYSIACLIGHFDGGIDPCLSESFIRNASGGVLAFIGNNRYGWGIPDFPPASPHSRGGPSMDFAYRFYEEVFGGSHVRMGDAFAQHKYMMRHQSMANGAYRWVQFGMNYQGDPALPIVIADGRPTLLRTTTRATGYQAYIEPGDTVSVTCHIINNGSVVLENLTGTLVSTTEWAQVVSPEERDFPSLAAWGEASNAVPYQIEIAEHAPPGTVRLPLYLTTVEKTWTDTVALTVVHLPRWHTTATSVWLIADAPGDEEASFLVYNKGLGALAYRVYNNLPLTITNYIWCDSTMPDGPSFEWHDIPQNATAVLLEENGYAGPFELPFAFPLYEDVYTHVWITANGGVRFTDGNVHRNNRGIPCDISTVVDGPFIAPLWDNLNPAHPGASVFFHTEVDRFMVTWQAVPRAGESEGLTFQLACYRDGRVTVAYRDIPGIISTATIGLQEGNIPLRGVQVAYNTPYATSDIFLVFNPVAEAQWLRYTPTHAILSAGETNILTFTANADMLVDTVYTSHIMIAHNDPGAPPHAFAVYFIVPEGAFSGIFLIIGSLLLRFRQ